MVRPQLRNPILFALLPIIKIALFVHGVGLFVGAGAEILSIWEKEGSQNPISFYAHRLREQFREAQREDPKLRKAIIQATGGSTTDLPDDSVSRVYADYFDMLYLAGFGSLVWYLVTGLPFTISIVQRLRKQQLLDRPPGSRNPDYAELCLYLSVSDDAACWAEILRDRYETEWEPQMGRFLASCWYVYEVTMIFPELWRETEKPVQSRCAQG